MIEIYIIKGWLIANAVAIMFLIVRSDRKTIFKEFIDIFKNATPVVIMILCMVLLIIILPLTIFDSYKHIKQDYENIHKRRL